MFSFFRKRPMLSDDANHRIVASIKEAESKTSGEIRVFIEHHCEYMDPLHRAQELFLNLGMDKTVARNAVIVYVALTDRQFALFGDKAIYEKAGGAAFWKGAAEKLTGHLRRKEVTEGLCNCIHELGTALATNFPYDPAIKKNELPDEIVFGK
jgi:uncharacterized membrane protein